MHSSAIGYHGMLTSANCLIDERWQVKIANFGLHYLRQLKKLTDDGSTLNIQKYLNQWYCFDFLIAS